jgi:hypothetical protein
MKYNSLSWRFRFSHISSYTTAATRQWLRKQRPLLSNGRNRHARKNGRAVGAVFSVLSVPKLYNEGQLPLQS